ncbi:MAG: hypothetical protein U9N86_08130 [Bacteroidota bacterium]|nr:hypothetical protein [Bacteroidota bacterium]
MENPDCCKDCGYKFSNERNGRVPCPVCGGKNRKMSPIVNDGINLSDSAGWKSTREFYEKNRALLLVVIAITIISPFLGLLLVGIPGLILGLLLGGVSYFLGPWATTKVREIERG